MRFHVVSLPHTQTTEGFSVCAYTNKIVGFCRMMKAEGHEVVLYAGDQNTAPCDELVTCFSEGDRLACLDGKQYVEGSFDRTKPHWVKFNNAVIEEMGSRIKPRDFICVIAGWAQEPIARAFPGHMTVEFGVGYGGTFAPYRVFESYAWMHTVYGAQSQGGPHAADGHWYDTVIPGYLDVNAQPFSEDKDDYLLYIGRMVDRKGIGVVKAVADETGLRLVTAGPGDPIPGADHRGIVGPQERGQLMCHAKALLVPTIYVEPFANVHVEAMACGTPVITTDWGVFTETVQNGRNGFRCRDLEQFVGAVDAVDFLDPAEIRTFALERFDLGVIGPRYTAYFGRLLNLWAKGWYTLNHVS